MRIPAHQNRQSTSEGGHSWVVVNLGDEGNSTDSHPLSEISVRFSSSMPNLHTAVEMGDTEDPKTCFSSWPRGISPRTRALLLTIKYFSYLLMTGSIFTGSIPSALLSTLGMIVFEGYNLTASCLNHEQRSALERINEGLDHASNTIYLVGNVGSLGVALGNIPAVVGGVHTSQLINLAKLVSLLPVIGLHEALTCGRPGRTLKERLRKIAGHTSGMGLTLLAVFAGVGSCTPETPLSAVYGLAGSGVSCLVGGSILADSTRCMKDNNNEEEEEIVPAGSSGSYGSTATTPPDCILNMAYDSSSEEEEGQGLTSVVIG